MHFTKLAAIFALATGASAWPLLTQDMLVKTPIAVDQAKVAIFKEGTVQVSKDLKVGGPVDLHRWKVADNAKLYLRDEPIVLKDIHVVLLDHIWLNSDLLPVLEHFNVDFPKADKLKAAFPKYDFVNKFPTLGEVQKKFNLEQIVLPEVHLRVDAELSKDIKQRFPEFPSFAEIRAAFPDVEDVKSFDYKAIKHAFSSVELPAVQDILAVPEISAKVQVNKNLELPKLPQLSELELPAMPELPELSQLELPAMPELPSADAVEATATRLRGRVSKGAKLPQLPVELPAVEDVVSQVVGAKTEVLGAKADIVSGVAGAKADVLSGVVDTKLNVLEGAVDAKLGAKKTALDVLPAALKETTKKVGSLTGVAADAKSVMTDAAEKIRSQLP